MISTRQRQLVRETWSQILPLQAAAAALFYDRLFALDPALRPLFPAELRAQRTLLVRTVTYLVDNLGDPERLLPVLQDLGRTQLRLGLRPRDCRALGEALAWALKQGLGTGFTLEVQDAWAAAYALVVDVLTEAMAEAIA